MKSRINKIEYKFEKYPTGSMSWYKNGDYHRDNNKPAIIYYNGDMEWHIDGELIRISRKYEI